MDGSDLVFLPSKHSSPAQRDPTLRELIGIGDRMDVMSVL
jgi:hypothetical protein